MHCGFMRGGLGGVEAEYCLCRRRGATQRVVGIGGAVVWRGRMHGSHFQGLHLCMHLGALICIRGWAFAVLHFVCAVPQAV